eukprot:935630-Amphidinium_carterae.1
MLCTSVRNVEEQCCVTALLWLPASTWQQIDVVSLCIVDITSYAAIVFYRSVIVFILHVPFPSWFVLLSKTRVCLVKNFRQKTEQARVPDKAWQRTHSASQRSVCRQV